MKNRNIIFNTCLTLTFFANLLFPIQCLADNLENQLQNAYEYFHQTPSTTNAHLPILRQLASQCTSVVEIGLYHMASTWGILYGLKENKSSTKKYLGIDISYPPSDILNYAENLATANGISFNFLKANDMEIDLEPTDFLFIDSLHTYCHLSYELEKFSPKVKKYIAMHDTSPPWGYVDDNTYQGNYSEYPLTIDRNKRGLWPAVEDFLAKHPEWKLKARLLNQYGFTILERIAN